MALLKLRGNLGLATGSNARNRKEFKTWVEKECTNQYDMFKRGADRVTYVCEVMPDNDRTTGMRSHRIWYRFGDHVGRYKSRVHPQFSSSSVT
jgi:hypothetical protein